MVGTDKRKGLLDHNDSLFLLSWIVGGKHKIPLNFCQFLPKLRSGLSERDRFWIVFFKHPVNSHSLFAINIDHLIVLTHKVFVLLHYDLHTLAVMPRLCCYFRKVPIDFLIEVEDFVSMLMMVVDVEDNGLVAEKVEHIAMILI